MACNTPDATVWAAQRGGEHRHPGSRPPRPAADRERFREEWSHDSATRPQRRRLSVIIRHMVVAETETRGALGIAERAYRRWRRHIGRLLWTQRGHEAADGRCRMPEEIGPLHRRRRRVRRHAGRRNAPISPSRWRSPAPTISSATSPSAISRSRRRCAAWSCSGRRYYRHFVINAAAPTSCSTGWPVLAASTRSRSSGWRRAPLRRIARSAGGRAAARRTGRPRRWECRPAWQPNGLDAGVGGHQQRR